MKTLAETNTAKAAYVLQSFKDALNATADTMKIDILIRDFLCGTYGMTSDLEHSRVKADRLRAEAFQIEQRAVNRLADDIAAEWTEAQIAEAATKLLNREISA